ncbi:MAG TPA: LysM peptidoglycan-binding domain-containing protein [Jatrophihabitantaceae bacterium]|nr:LysM peptidoglycan-binding domain-containing protein [Jatrophihabitantaceae bacterium]
MSVATEFPPEVYIPVSARPRTATVLVFPPRGPAVGPDRAADVGSLRHAADETSRVYPVRATSVSYRPAAREATVPVRLTRRGYAVVGLLAAVLAAGVLWLAHSSAGSARPATGTDAAVVTVGSGDTLWSIASRIAPQRDPRTVVAALEQINHLTNPVLQPGQVLRTR